MGNSSSRHSKSSSKVRFRSHRRSRPPPTPPPMLCWPRCTRCNATAPLPQVFCRICFSRRPPPAPASWNTACDPFGENLPVGTWRADQYTGEKRYQSPTPGKEWLACYPPPHWDLSKVRILTWEEREKEQANWKKDGHPYAAETWDKARDRHKRDQGNNSPQLGNWARDKIEVIRPGIPRRVVLAGDLELKTGAEDPRERQRRGLMPDFTGGRRRKLLASGDIKGNGLIDLDDHKNPIIPQADHDWYQVPLLGSRRVGKGSSSKSIA